MKITVDEQADAVYVKLEDAKIIDSEEVRPGVVLDYDKKGRIVGFEVLNFSKNSKLPFSVEYKQSDKKKRKIGA